LGAHDDIDSEVGDPAQALQAMGGAQAIIATVTEAGMMDEIQTKNILLGIAPLLPTNNRPFRSSDRKCRDDFTRGSYPLAASLTLGDPLRTLALVACKPSCVWRAISSTGSFMRQTTF
jgi:hypothetical protein